MSRRRKTPEQPELRALVRTLVESIIEQTRKAIETHPITCARGIVEQIDGAKQLPLLTTEQQRLYAAIVEQLAKLERPVDLSPRARMILASLGPLPDTLELLFGEVDRS